MEFLTIHELSTQFDTTARIIRYHFHRLRRAGKLTEDHDFKRDKFVDDQHFEWKINPVSFMRASGMVLSPVAPRTSPAPAVTNVATKPASVVIQTDNQTPPVVNKMPPVDNQPSDTVTKPVNHPPAKSSEPGLEREIITLLKDQMRVKDGQITDLSEQNKKLNDLNVKLVGTTVQQQNQIQDLLRLTGGKSDFSEVVAKDGNQTSVTDTKVDNQTEAAVNHSDTKSTEHGHPLTGEPDSFSAGQGSERAA